MRRRLGRGDDSGSAVAEFAVALPVVVLTILLGIGALSAAAIQVALQDAVSDAARLLARGEPDGRAQAAVEASVPGARWEAHRGDGLVCVVADVPVRAGPIALPLRAYACALDGGR